MADTWWTAPAESADGDLIMVTGRDKIENLMNSGKYTYRVEVSWTYGTHGMPDEADAKLMEEATDALTDTFAKDKVAVITGIYTGAGKREWVMYVKKLTVFQAAFNRALSTLPTLPIVVEAYSDPEWEEYREMRDNTYIPDKD